MKEDYEIIISPVEGLEGMVHFDLGGVMIENAELSEYDKQRVMKTIEIFNLNHSALVSMRRGLIDSILQYKEMDSDIIRESLKNQGFPTLIDWMLRVMH